jgi:ribose transport system substrate-binding protein
MNRKAIWIGAAAVALAMVGCSGDKQADNGGGQPGKAAEGSGKTYRVVFSQCNNNEPYRAAQNDLMTKLWAEKNGVDFEIQDAQKDNNKQIEQIRTIIRTKPDLLIVAPNEKNPLTAPMKEAKDAGIKVICLERDIAQPNYDTLITCDNTAIGRLVGQFIVDYLKKKYGEPKGNIVQIEGLQGVTAEHERADGAAEVYAKYPGIKVVHTATADWDQSKAKDRMMEALNANPKIDVVYGHNDPMAIGAYLAAKDKGREKEMIFIGVDGLKDPEGGIAKVRDGVLAATFIYPLCVDKAVEIGWKMLTDPSFQPDIRYVMPSEPVTPANAAKLLEEK